MKLFKNYIIIIFFYLCIWNGFESLIFRKVVVKNKNNFNIFKFQIK